MAMAIAEQEASTEELTVELDIPDYFPEAENLRHPNKFFSGQPLRLRGDFSGLHLELVQVELQGRERGVERQIEIQRATPTYINVEVPQDIPTDLYELTLTIGGRTHTAAVTISGFSEEELRAIESGEGAGGGGGVGESKLHPAVLYTSMIQCVRCYWEHVLTGRAIDSNHLALIGQGSLYVTTNGARTWTGTSSVPDSLININGLIDPNALVTPDGTLLVSGLNWISPAVGDPSVVIGVLFQGPVTGNTFTGRIFKNVVEGVELQQGTIFIDYPKLAYDPNVGTIYISGNLVRFSQTRAGNGLFVSQDGGRSFKEQRLKRVELTKEIILPDGRRLGSTIIGGPIWSMAVTPGGELRALIKFPDYGKAIDPERREPFGLLRFDTEAQDFEFIQIGSAWLQHPARVSSESDRGWHVYEGPEIAIDKSDRHLGRIYVIWGEPESVVEDPEFQFGKYGKNFDIFLTHSDDDGETWSERLKVNDDRTAGDQIFPSIQVDSEGVVHIAFLDKRENPESHYYDVYYAKIVDGTVSRNIRTNPDHIANAYGGREPGDYLEQLVAYPEKVYVSYACGRPVLAQNRWECQSGSDGYEPRCACISSLNPVRVPFPGEFIRGDSNGDFDVDISDAIKTLNWLYLGETQPACMDAVDANDDGKVDMSDAIVTLGVLFQGSPHDLPEPFSEPGKDVSQDSLLC